MAKPKSPKLYLSLLTSLQICRPKNPCSMIKSPLPRAPPYMLSPLNSKTFDISFPGTPIPPPSTPTSLDCRFSSSRLNSPHASDSDDDPPSTVPSSRNHKSSKSCIRSTTSSSRDNDSSSPPSFNKTEAKAKHKPRRFKRYGSKEWKEGEEYEERKPMLGRLAPCMLSDGKMEQSFVVVKKSVDPYEDFKKSMSEMIVAKQIFEPKELEQLLMSFLSLNSQLHHKVIIEAFTEILKEVLCG